MPAGGRGPDLRRILDHDLTDRLDEISCPVTLVTGSETDPVQRMATNALARRFGSSPVVLPGADHFGPMQQPRQFARAVADSEL